MNSRIPFIYLIGIFFFSCKRMGSPNPPELSIKYMDDSLIMVEQLDTFGITTFTVYVKGIKDSNKRKREIYFPEGQILSREYFNQKGELNGSIKEYYQNGCLSAKAQYVHGMKNGRSVFYYSDCSIQRAVEYKGDMVDGYDSIWAESGSLKEVFKYSKNTLIDTGYIFDREGRDSIKYIFDQGVLIDSIHFH